MDKGKIGIDCRLINKQQNTGISRYTEFLIDYYSTKFPQNDIFLITNDISFSDDRFKIIFTKLKPFNLIHFFLFGHLIRRIGIDYIHSPFYSSLFFKPKKLIAIITVHDLMYRIVAGFFGRSSFLNFVKKTYFDFIVSNSLKKADRVISISKTTQNDVLKNFGITSFHIPEDSCINVTDNDNIIKQHGLKHKEFFFYCGNSRPHKNLSIVIDTFNENPQLPCLVLAGKNHLNSANVINVGVVTDEELYSLYRHSQAFIFPSTYEGFGLPVLEAIRSKSIVIASKIPAFLEFKSKNIIYFDQNSKNDLLSAILRATSTSFTDDSEFLSNYSHLKIFEMNDALLFDFFQTYNYNIK